MKLFSFKNSSKHRLILAYSRDFGNIAKNIEDIFTMFSISYKNTIPIDLENKFNEYIRVICVIRS